MFNNNEQSQMLNMQKNEEEILNQAIAAFIRQTNLPMEKMLLDTNQLALPLNDTGGVDALVRIDVPPRAIQFWVKVRPTLDNTAMARTAHEFAADTRQWLLATRHVQAKLMGALRELHVQFIDTAGNAFIDVPPLYVQIQGNRREEKAFEETKGGMLGKAGLKLLFALLCKRELCNATYREMAKAAQVALGTAAGVTAELKAQGYLIEMAGQQRRLVRRKELLDKWLTAYKEKLGRKTLIGKFKTAMPELWREADVNRFDAQWGGEAAAYRLTHYNKPEVTTIYARKPVNNLTLDLKLRQDKNGDVELRERFWDFETVETDKTVVPPLLVYADLMVTGDPRNIETAKHIYDDYLQRHIEQD